MSAAAKCGRSLLRTWPRTWPAFSSAKREIRADFAEIVAELGALIWRIDGRGTGRARQLKGCELHESGPRRGVGGMGAAQSAKLLALNGFQSLELPKRALFALASIFAGCGGSAAALFFQHLGPVLAIGGQAESTKLAGCECRA